MRIPYDAALVVANEFISKFINGEYVIAGSIRRKEATIGDVDIITSDPLSRITTRLESNVFAKKVNGGAKKMDVDYKNVRFNLYFALQLYWAACSSF